MPIGIEGYDLFSNALYIEVVPGIHKHPFYMYVKLHDHISYLYHFDFNYPRNVAMVYTYTCTLYICTCLVTTFKLTQISFYLLDNCSISLCSLHGGR